ncbi:MAG TPA: hypothetical protein VIS52_05455, partial [Motiliproteus sp.]
SAAEVSSIVSCKRDGELWLCGAWRQGQVEVFRSETYITQVEFDARADAQLQAALTKPHSGRMVEANASAPTYTLQLLACREPGCVESSGLMAIPASRKLEVKRNGQLWQLLAVGEYPSMKAAQQAAAKLILEFKLRDKPWVRTLDSVNNLRLAP